MATPVITQKTDCRDLTEFRNDNLKRSKMVTDSSEIREGDVGYPHIDINGQQQISRQMVKFQMHGKAQQTLSEAVIKI